MALRVLIFQTDIEATRILEGFFSKRGDHNWRTDNETQALDILTLENPDLVLVDLHAPEKSLFNILGILQKSYPETRVIVTNKYPDLKRELLAKERGVKVFLREPFTPSWIENALIKLSTTDQREKGMPVEATTKGLPKVRVPVRLKITFPYVLLALVFAVAITLLVSRYVLESLQERFVNQLVDASYQASDWMVQEENQLLNTLRLISFTKGIGEAITDENSEELRQIVLPVSINYRVEAIDILNLEGISLLSLRHKIEGSIEDYDFFRGDSGFGSLGFVQNILEGGIDNRGDKFAGIYNSGVGKYFTVAGPIYQGDQFVGVIGVGTSLETLVSQMRENSLAQIALYSKDGEPLVSSFAGDEVQKSLKKIAPNILAEQDSRSRIRLFVVASSKYSELLGAWEARGGEDLGILGVSLIQNFVFRPSSLGRLQAFLIVILAFLSVFLLGVYLAGRITRPLSTIVNASTELAQGNLDVRVPTEGNDEIAVMAHAFNYMVSGLQEGVIYRDLLGRTVSPEVRDALRQSFAKGELRLEGQDTIATVVMSDIRGFTSISEKADPTTILAWLNEYFSVIVPIISMYGGVVDKFEGDAMVAFFGILPAILPPHESAYQACNAALKILGEINQMNQNRTQQNVPSLITGISINTGHLTAGSLGAFDRLNFTIIGDTVNTTQRMQDTTRGFGESGVVISESTFDYLQECKNEFNFESLGKHNFKGKLEAVQIYRLKGIKT